MAKIWILDDEPNIGLSLRLILEREGHTIRVFPSIGDLRAGLFQDSPDLFLLDVRLPDGSGIEMLKQLGGKPAVMISGHGTIADAVEAIHAGAFDFLEKPLSRDRVLVAIKNALEAYRLKAENKELRQRLVAEVPRMIGGSSAWKQVVDQATLAVLSRIRDHPEVHTIFVSANATVKVLQKGAGSQFVARRNGFTRAWKLLPRTVKRIIVLRDVQSRALSTLDCIEGAMAKKRPPGTSCAVRRTSALRPDSQASAARSFKRARVADLSAFSCSRRLCMPVVGGALVNKDQTHMTTTFAKTLGPYLLRQVATFGPFPGERAPSAMDPTGSTGATGTARAEGPA